MSTLREIYRSLATFGMAVVQDGHLIKLEDFLIMTKPILCLDFDGVIHSYTSGWQGPTVIEDPPVEGALEFIRDAQRVFDIAIHSTRSATVISRAKMMGWIHDRLVEAFGETEGEKISNRIDYPRDKPPAFVTLDDRAITFTGTFPDPIDLVPFKPWNKK